MPSSPYYFPILFLLPSITSLDKFQCPTFPISTNGSFPIGASAPIVFPQLYNCTIQFVIDDGFVVHLIARKLDGTPDLSIVVNDTLNEQYKFSNVNYDKNEIDAYLPAKSAMVQILTQLEDSYLFISWQFLKTPTVSANHLSGAPVQLRLFQFEPVTFRDADSERIVVRAEKRAIFSDVFVYDGFSLYSKYIGKLGQGGQIEPSGSAVTLVTYENVFFNYAVLAIKQKYIASFESLYFDKIDHDQIYSYVLPGGASIVYSPSSAVSLNGITAYNFEGSINIKRGIPNDTPPFETVISYPNPSALNASMPQQIISSLFTFTKSKVSPHSSFTEISLSPDASTSEEVWAGKIGSILPRSFWDQNATSNYDRRFYSQSIVQFTFNLTMLQIQTRAESLHIEVGGVGEPTVFDLAKQDAKLFSKSVLGNYMTVRFGGMKDVTGSKFRIEFRIDEAPTSTTTTTTTPTTTTSTTTTSTTTTSTTTIPTKPPSTSTKKPSSITTSASRVTSPTIPTTTRTAVNAKFTLLLFPIIVFL